MASGGITQFRRAIARMALQGEGPLTLEEILTDRALLQCSRRRADDASIENLLFWLEVMRTTSRSTSAAISGASARGRSAQVHRSVRADGVGVRASSARGSRRRSRRRGLKRGGPPYLFDAVLHDVVFSMKYDIYPRFLGSRCTRS